MRFGQNHGLMNMDGHATNAQSLDCFAVYMVILRLELMGSES
jgi:hypothetical protein